MTFYFLTLSKTTNVYFRSTDPHKLCHSAIFTKSSTTKCCYCESAWTKSRTPQPRRPRRCRRRLQTWARASSAFVTSLPHLSLLLGRSARAASRPTLREKCVCWRVRLSLVRYQRAATDMWTSTQEEKEQLQCEIALLQAQMEMLQRRAFSEAQRYLAADVVHSVLQQQLAHFVDAQMLFSALGVRTVRSSDAPHLFTTSSCPTSLTTPLYLLPHR